MRLLYSLQPDMRPVTKFTEHPKWYNINFGHHKSCRNVFAHRIYYHIRQYVDTFSMDSRHPKSETVCYVIKYPALHKSSSNVTLGPTMPDIERPRTPPSR